jgi:hypothetical protein
MQLMTHLFRAFGVAQQSVSDVLFDQKKIANSSRSRCDKIEVALGREGHLTYSLPGEIMEIVKKIFKRTIALVILKVSAVLAAGSIGGVELWQSALIAAFVGVMEVAESLARAYVVDGVLDEEEINVAFASSAEAALADTKKAAKVADDSGL